MTLVFLIFAFVLFVLAATNLVADVTTKVRLIAAGLGFWIATLIFTGAVTLMR